MDLKGRVAVVTGGSSGIGRSIAIGLASRGAKISIGDVQEIPREGGETTKNIIEAKDGEAIFNKTDVSNEDQVRKMIDSTYELFGGIDILVNNAACDQCKGTVEEIDKEEWDRVININLTGSFLCSKYSIPHLKLSKNARIVNIASQLGLVGYGNRPAYCASKGGIISFSRQLAIEYAEVPILVNSVCPGLVQTNRTKDIFEDERLKKSVGMKTPLPYLGIPEDISGVVEFLCSDSGRFITGTEIVVDGGYVAK